MAFTRLLTPILVLAFVASSCGSSEPKEDVVTEGPAAAFHGVWKGDYKKLDEEGLELKQTRAKAEFTATDETKGKFDIRFPEEDDSSTKGLFQIFNHTTLVLEIEESNYSAIGLSGSVAKLDFELSKSIMVLETDEMEILLVRDKKGSISEDGDQTKTKETILGRWACVDKADSSWDFSIDEKSFNVSVTGTGNNYFTMNGDIASSSDSFSAASLLITYAPESHQAYTGRTLNVSRTKKGIDVIMVVGDRQVDQFSCEKK